MWKCRDTVYRAQIFMIVKINYLLYGRSCKPACGQAGRKITTRSAAPRNEVEDGQPEVVGRGRTRIFMVVMNLLRM